MNDKPSVTVTEAHIDAANELYESWDARHGGELVTLIAQALAEAEQRGQSRGAGRASEGVCPNCGYAPVIALPPPESRAQPNWPSIAGAFAADTVAESLGQWAVRCLGIATERRAIKLAGNNRRLLDDEAPVCYGPGRWSIKGGPAEYASFEAACVPLARALYAADNSLPAPPAELETEAAK